MSPHQALLALRLLRGTRIPHSRHKSISGLSQRVFSQCLYKHHNIVRWYSSHQFPPKPVNFPYEVTLGKIRRVVENPPGKSKLVPEFLNPLERYLTSTDIRHLEWMAKKELMKQDMFLIGPPGGYKRRLVKLYGYVMSREMEMVQISRDTTEADIKQRREIKDKSVVYHDQASVRCALNGHVLVLDGIEKAERNVLPLLNNLLENREMHLEDGRLLIPHTRYDTLLKEHGLEAVQRWKLERVHEDFRVIALGLPVPTFKGNPLDPPLRSRFQARNVGGGITRDEIISVLLNTTLAGSEGSAGGSISAPVEDAIRRIVDLGYGINMMRDYEFKERSGPQSQAFLSDEKEVPWFVVDNLFDGTRLFQELVSNHGKRTKKSASLLLPSVFSMMYPFKTKQVQSLVSQHLGEQPSQDSLTPATMPPVAILSPKPLPSQLNSLSNIHSFVKLNNSQRAPLLFGPGGSGKSTVASYLENLLQRPATVIQVYKDMSTRELFQTRSTDAQGNTLWQDNALTKCARNGEICILDGIQSLHGSVYSVLGKLVQDGQVVLPDGESVLVAHPDFRLVAIADSGEMELNEDISSVFLVFPVKMDEQDELKVAGKEGTRLLAVTKELRRRGENGDKACKSLARSLSVGQVKRISKRVERGEGRSLDLFKDVLNATLGMFLPMMERDLLVDILKSCGIVQQKSRMGSKSGNKRLVEVTGDTVKIGSVVAPISPDTEFNGKIPKGGRFFDIDQHVELLEALADDFVHGGDHLLVIGNQGVGKNKLVDRLLELMNRPREYIQLHRDTTVQSLTTSQRIEKGVIITDDSPLVNAARHGLVLVVDEADKAPAHVTAILKTLAERGEMHLSDGRVISSRKGNTGTVPDNVIPLHPDFRMMVLANRPGFPFLGNSFYSVLSHLFSVHPVDNPRVDSEIQLLRSYGPDVPMEDITKIAKIFAELRGLSDEGVLAYPYSTREAVHVVKQLQTFPGDWSGALSNVFDFDRWSEDVWKVVERAVEGNLGIVGVLRKQADKEGEGPILKIHDVDKKGGEGVESPRTDFSKFQDPKEGKFDPTGNPHVGGNQWAGGSGGMSTAGLGGVGGPYRLTDGNPVFQVSPEVKNSVPPEVLQKARELSKQLYEEKLKELQMSKHDGKVYNDYLDPIRPQIQTLRNILDSVQSKSKERKWARHQTTGDLDDQKLIEGLIGDKNVYKQRQEMDPEMGDPQEKPKLLRLLVDCSGSMYRFNAMDGRMNRMLSCVLMVMEAFAGYEHMFKFEINLHSGDEYDFQLVGKDDKLKEERGRLEVMKRAFLHAQFCMSGDNTLEATAWSLKELQKLKDEHDEVFLVVLSDANLERYGISASEFGRVLKSQGSEDVKAYCVFIGSIGDQAKRLQESLPVGKGFVCMDTAELPKIFQRVFTEGILR